MYINKGSEMEEIKEKLLKIFKNVFDDEFLVVSPNASSKDIPGWDSLAHIRLMLNIQESFKLNFSAAEIDEIENYGQILELILKSEIKNND
jgi:acyl carrier protein